MLFSGDCSKQDSGVPKVRLHAIVRAVPGLRTRAIRVGRLLGVCRGTANHQLAPPGGHVQDGTGLGPGRGRRSKTPSPRHQRPPGGRRFDHATHTRRAH